MPKIFKIKNNPGTISYPTRYPSDKDSSTFRLFSCLHQTQRLLNCKVHSVILILECRSWWFVFREMKEPYLYMRQSTFWFHILAIT